MSYTRKPGMKRSEVLASEIEPGMVIVVGSGKRNSYRDTLLDVARIEGSASYPIFRDNTGRRIYRWGSNVIEVLGWWQKKSEFPSVAAVETPKENTK